MTAPGVPAHARSSSARRLVLFLVGCLVVGALLGVLGGWLWVHFANPPRVPVESGGVVLGEVALDAQAGETVWFMVVGAVLGAVAGLAVGWTGARHGWVTVLGVLLLCGAGTVVSRYLGHQLFGADTAAAARQAGVGHLVRLGVDIGTPAAYLGWPIGGLVGAVAGISGWAESPAVARHSEVTTTDPERDS